MICGYTGDLLDFLACILYSTFPFLEILSWCLFVGLFFTPFWYISAFYSVWWFYDRNTPELGGRRFNFFRQLGCWKYLARYFPAKLYKTCDLDPSKNYLFAYHPHGLPAFGAFINFATNANGFDEMFPGITVYPLTHSVQYTFPFFRDLMLAAGARSVSADSLAYRLTQLGPGHSALIAIGGAPEMHLCEPNSYTLKLNSRKGFVRMALKTGALVIPVFTFNEQRTFETPIPEKDSFPERLLRLMRMFLKIAPPMIIRGRWWWVGSMLPKQLPLNTVVGAPIDFAQLKSITKGEPISDVIVDECHQIYKDTLTTFYDEHKGRFGDADTPLIFI